MIGAPGIELGTLKSARPISPSGGDHSEVAEVACSRTFELDIPANPHLFVGASSGVVVRKWYSADRRYERHKVGYREQGEREDMGTAWRSDHS